MLHLIPAPAHRMVLRLAHGLRRSWWIVRKPRVAGCRVLAIDERGRVLLVRHSYGSGAWMPPGGGLERGENPVAAAQRELLEETGCTLQWAALIERAQEPLHGAANNVHIVAGETFDHPLADGREIIEARFFELCDLPDFMPRTFGAKLPGWVTAAIAARPPDAVVARARPPAPTG